MSDQANDQGYEGPDMSDAGKRGDTLTQGPDSPAAEPQQAIQGGQEQQPQRQRSSGGVNQRALKAIRGKTNQRPVDGQPTRKGFLGRRQKTGRKAGRNNGRFSKGVKKGAANYGKFATKKGGKQLAKKAGAALVGAPAGPVGSAATTAALIAAEQVIRHKKLILYIVIGIIIFFVSFFLMIIQIVFDSFSVILGGASQTLTPTPTPITSFISPTSSNFIIRKTGPATAKATPEERLVYNIQLIDTRGVSDISVTDKIPDGTNYISSTGNGQFNPATKIVTWNLKGSQSVNIILQPTSTNANSYLFNAVYASSTFAGSTEIGQSCWQTTVGRPASQPNPPEGCQQIPTTGIVYPPNLGPCKPVNSVVPRSRGGIPGEYCKLPPSLDGAYVYKLQSRKAQNWGSKEMIGVLYTVAQRWKQKYPDGHLTVMDITSDYHKSRFWGATVDLVATTNGKDCVADWKPYKGGRCNFGKYNAEATVWLGRFIIDTGYMHAILHNGSTKHVIIADAITGVAKNTTVNKAIFDYAKTKYPTRFRFYNDYGVGIQEEPGHDDHFHLYIDRDQAYNNYRYNTRWDDFNKSKLQDCRSVPGIGCGR